MPCPGEPLRRRFGTRHGAAEAVLDGGDLVDEEVRRGAGADSEDGAHRESVGHVITGGTRHRLLQFVLGHDAFHDSRVNSMRS
jgi:hypothetical protein